MIATSLIAVVSAALINLGLTPLIIRLSHHYKWYDLPDKRKIHKGLIPRLGGMGMFLSSALVFLGLPRLLALVRGEPSFLAMETRMIYPLLGILIVHLLGLYDDLRNVKAVWKFLLQIAAAVLVTMGEFRIGSFKLPYLGTVTLGILSYPLTVLWIVGISNAINLIDGMDGLAGGISAFASLAMGIIALIKDEPVTALLAFSLFGAIAGFLVFNLPPAKIFMGDSGALFLGFILAILPLMGIPKSAALGTLIVPITLLTIPIIDTTAAIIRRIRKKRSIIAPDREHIHHKLLDLGMSEQQILSVVYGFCLYLSIISITSVVLPEETNVYLVLIVWLGSMLSYWSLGLMEAKRGSSTLGKSSDEEDFQDHSRKVGS